MSLNRELADCFEQIADLLELTEANSFRVSAHRRAARVIADSTEDFAALAEDKKSLMAIEGIGQKVADKIVEYVHTEKIAERETLLEEVPSGLLDVLKIPGVGPKTVRLLWQDRGVTCLADLEQAIEDDTITDLPRMGAKTVENMRKAIRFASKETERIPLGVAASIADVLVERFEKMKAVKRVVCAGSLRRGKETIGDLDLLIATKAPDEVSETFRTMPEVEEVLAAGATKSSVRLLADVDGRKRRMQVDLRVIEEASFGAALMYFTGSKQHNVRLRERAQKQKLTLNEYGLFPEDGEGAAPQKRGVKPVAAKSEEEIYAALELPYIAPELREDRGEFDLSAAPRLVEVQHIKSELHAHTTASDGRLSIEELAREAKARGFHTIAVTDHSKSQTIAGGLSPEALRKHIAAIRRANETVEGIAILAGSEVDILPDGSLDYDDDLLAELDVVVASPHWSLKQDAAKATPRLIRAIEHPLVNVIGHPTGRLINRREGLTPDIREVIAAAKEHDTALEINAHWMRLDLRDIHVRAAVEAGAFIAIDCDVHSASDFENIRFGVATARRGWLPKDRCVNTWTAAKLAKWLKKNRS